MKNKIRLLRKHKGMKLKNLADRLDTTPQTVSRLETGNMTLSTDWIKRIAQVLEVDPLDIFEQENDFPLYGQCNSKGIIIPFNGLVSLKMNVNDPVVIHMQQAFAIWREGEIIVADKNANFSKESCYALAMQNNETVYFGTAWQKNDQLHFVPLPDYNHSTNLNTHDYTWLAPIIYSFMSYRTVRILT